MNKIWIQKHTSCFFFEILHYPVIFYLLNIDFTDSFDFETIKRELLTLPLFEKYASSYVSGIAYKLFCTSTTMRLVQNGHFVLSKRLTKTLLHLLHCFSDAESAM